MRRVNAVPISVEGVGMIPMISLLNPEAAAQGYGPMMIHVIRCHLSVPPSSSLQNILLLAQQQNIRLRLGLDSPENLLVSRCKGTSVQGTPAQGGTSGAKGYRETKLRVEAYIRYQDSRRKVVEGRDQCWTLPTSWN